MTATEKTCTHCGGDGRARIDTRDVGDCVVCDGTGVMQLTTAAALQRKLADECKCNAVERRREVGSHVSVDTWVCSQCGGRFARADSVRVSGGRMIEVEIPDHVEQAKEAQARISKLTVDIVQVKSELVSARAELSSQRRCAQRADEYARGERDGLRWVVDQLSASLAISGTTSWVDNE